MSTDATTTDGFRVGRRVIDTYGCGEGTIREAIGKSQWSGEMIYCVFFDGHVGPFSRTPSQLGLLPEPDAPATPEPAPADDDKPHHYAKLREAGCEPFAVIRGCMSREKAVAYHQGTAIAYLIRAEHKHDSPDDDIRKAHAHLAEAVAILDGRTA